MTGKGGRTTVRRLAMGAVATLVASALAMVVGAPAASATPWLTFVRSIQTRPFVGTSTSMGDNEGMAYVAANDKLWVVDDVPGRLYEVNRTTGALGQVVTSAQFQAATVLGGTEAAGPNRVKDIEAIAYDSVTDKMYVFSGTCCTVDSLPTVFRLSRANTASAFAIDSWQPLLAPYNDLSGASFRNGELWAAAGKTIVKYDYVTNTASSPTLLSGAPSAIYSLGFNASGSEMWVVGSSAKVVKFDWATKAPVAGFAWTMYALGVNDPRAVELVGTQLYFSDGYDYYPAGSTSAFGVRVFDLVDVTVTAPVASFTATPTSGNVPLSVAFTDTSTNAPMSWSWNFGDGTVSTSHNPTKVYSTPGIYNVTMTATNPGGSSTSAALTINAGNVPVASFTKSLSTGAVPLSVTFTDTSTNTPTAWAWNFGDGTPAVTTKNATHIFQDPGVYNVTLLASNASGSNQSLSQAVVVTSAGGGLTNTFAATEDASVDQLVTTPKPTATTLYTQLSPTTSKRSYLKFNVTGLANPVTSAILRLYVTDATDNGAKWYLLNTNTWSQTTLTYANAPAIAGLALADPGALPVNTWVDIDVTSAVTGNGTFSFVNEPQSANQERYNSREALTNQPQLVISTTSGSVPTASFTKSAATGTAPLSVTFADASTNSPTSWSWNFGDGTPVSTVQNPSHSFAAAGVYNVTLTATNVFGSNVSVAQTVTVTAPPMAPVASFTKSASSGPAPLSVNFTDTSSNTPTAWSWNFGDGSPVSIEQFPSHTYTAAGTYNVTLTATNAVGSNTSASQAIVVSPSVVAPVASFTKSASSGTAPLTVNFTDTSANVPTSWSWNFGDGTPASTVENPSHTFTVAGTYNVTLTATNGVGSNTSAAQVVTVTGAAMTPVASFTKSASSGTAPLTVNFTDTSTGSPAVSGWSWNFGDGTAFDTTQNPSHVFATPGLYSVTLTATNVNGSSTSAAQLVTVTAAPVTPVASFTKSASSGTAPLTVNFTDTSTNVPTSWSWNFGDGGAAVTTQNASRTFTTAGVYNVTLTATNAAGSNTTVAETVTVTAGAVTPAASFTKSAVSGAAPLTVNFTDTSTNVPTSWSWNFGDGGAAVTTQNASRTFTVAGTYNVTLTATNAAGSNTTVAQTVTVTGGGGATTKTFAAAEDASVDSTVTTPKPTSSTLYNLLSTKTQRTYLKFNVTGVTGTVTNAKLRIWVTDGTDNGAAWYKIANNTWSQTTLTWANAPTLTGATLVGDPAAVTVGVWLEIPVTAHVTGNGTYSFANLPTSANAEKYTSKEGLNPPQLVITTS